MSKYRTKRQIDHLGGRGKFEVSLVYTVLQDNQSYREKSINQTNKFYLALWCIPTIPAVGSLRQEDHEYKVSLD